MEMKTEHPRALHVIFSPIIHDTEIYVTRWSSERVVSVGKEAGGQLSMMTAKQRGGKRESCKVFLNRDFFSRM